MAWTDYRIQQGEYVVAAGSTLPDVANRRLDVFHNATGAHTWEGGSSVASAATITAPDNENYFIVTGTATIAGIANADATYPGMDIIVKFTSSLTLTHSASFIMPKNADYQVVAGEVIRFHEISAGIYQFVSSSIGNIFNKGEKKRAKLSYSTTTAILVDSGWYHTDGLVEQIAFWNSQLTFTFGPAGSNASSSAIGTSQFLYLYIDDSTVTPNVSLTAANMIGLTTAPTYSQAKGGWYNGNDRCIGAVWIDAGGLIYKFYHDGSKRIDYDAYITDANAITPSSVYTNVTLTIPGFATVAEIQMGHVYIDSATRLQWRPNGSTSTTYGIGVYVEAAGIATNAATALVTTDTGQIMQIQTSSGSTNQVYVHTSAFYLPGGM